jgi:hypothetical protein
MVERISRAQVTSVGPNGGTIFIIIPVGRNAVDKAFRRGKWTMELESSTWLLHLLHRGSVWAINALPGRTCIGTNLPSSCSYDSRVTVEDFRQTVRSMGTALGVWDP